MTLILELNPNVERRLQKEAESRGLDGVEYALAILESALPEEEDVSKIPIFARLDLPSAERIALLRVWEAGLRKDLPPIPPDALERENLYRDHF